MVNHPGYSWKNMIGPRDRRPPYAGTWYRYSTNGWGIVDFMNFCEAAGFEYVPAFNIDETPQDMADFIEYANGPAGSEWGRQAGGRRAPQPYRLKYLELGNEERVDEKYAAKFEALAEAIWAQDPGVILVVGDFVYGKPIQDPFRFDAGRVGHHQPRRTAAILRLAKEHQARGLVRRPRRHGPARCHQRHAGRNVLAGRCLGQDRRGARHKVVVFELNAGNHAKRRALANALAIQAIERDGRIPITTSANCLQPDGQNDNGWDQGLLFLNPGQVWLQPPGYVTQMLSRNYLPVLVKCRLTGGKGQLDANAKRSADGKTLVLQVVNTSALAVPAQIRLAGFVPLDPRAGHRVGRGLGSGEHRG